MDHPFRIGEIAQQSGLSEATVDRVLHGRGGVRASTAAEVNQAMKDLGRQQTQLRLGGRTFLIDLVLDIPAPFAAAVRQAIEGELPTLRPAVIRSSFHFSDGDPVADQIRVLDSIIGRGSHGVILKAPEVPEVNEAVQRLERAGIPVVTLVTDLPASPRQAYVRRDDFRGR